MVLPRHPAGASSAGLGALRRLELVRLRSSFLHVSSSAASAFFSSVSASNSAGVGPPKLALRKSIGPPLVRLLDRETKTFVRLSMTPADSRRRNASFFCSVACGGYAARSGSKATRRFGANETARNRELEDGARAAREPKTSAKRRVGLGALHGGTLTLTDWRSGRDATRRASEGTRTGFERNASITNGTRAASVRRTRTRAPRPRAREVPFTFRNCIAKRRAVSRGTREAPWTPLRVQTRPRETGRGFRTISTEVRPVCAVGACVVRARVSVFRSVRRGTKTARSRRA